MRKTLFSAFIDSNIALGLLVANRVAEVYAITLDTLADWFTP
jgi:hypothetical protein